MSKQTIAEKAAEIRSETQAYANTRARVADVLDDINETKADKAELDSVINEGLAPLQRAITDEVANREQAVSDEADARKQADAALNEDLNGLGANVSLISDAINAHKDDKNNPHSVTAEQVGLGNVNNTSDADKPVSTAQNTAISKKISKPTSTQAAPDVTFKYVPLLDANGNSTQMLAGDLGKNIANSALTSVAGAAFTLGAAYTWNSAGFPLYITNLPDKSSDTAFSQLLVENAAGQMGRSANYQMMINAMTAMSDAQKDAYRAASRKTGENYANGAVKIGTIIPQVLKSENIQDILVIGQNMFIDPAQSVVKVVNVATGQVYLPVNNTIQSLSITPNVFSFKLDCSVLPEGKYKILVTNWLGIANTTDTETFEISNQLSMQSLPTLIWEVQNNPLLTHDENKVIFRDKVLKYTVSKEAGSSNFDISSKSSVLIPASIAQGDWSYSFTVSLMGQPGGLLNNINGFYFGIGKTSNALLGSGNKSNIISGAWMRSNFWDFPKTAISGLPNTPVRVTLLKQGLIIKILIMYANGNLSASFVNLLENFTYDISFFTEFGTEPNGMQSFGVDISLDTTITIF